MRIRSYVGWFSVAAAFVACTSTSSGPNDDDDDGSGAGSQGGATAQGSCDEYIGCVAAVQPDGLDDTIATYGDNGSCWTQLSVAQCEQACDVALTAQRMANPDVPECGGSGSGGGGAGGSLDCPSACAVIYQCGSANDGMLCPTFIPGGVDEQTFLNGPNFDDGCLAGCASNPLLTSLVDPDDCPTTIANLKSADPEFAATCQGFSGGGGAGGG